MSTLNREIVFLVLQFLEEHKFKDAIHTLERESGYFFNMKYLEEKVLAGEWDEVEKYLSGFIKADDNGYSIRIFLEIRKQKYLEALDRNDKDKAIEILVKDLKVFSTSHEELYKEITQLLTLENFRENKKLAKHGDTISARRTLLVELKKLLEGNPLSSKKLVFPNFEATRLRTLLNQSLNWQHMLCKNPRPNPEIDSFFTDHSCLPPNEARASTSVTSPVAEPSTYAPLGVHGCFPSNPTTSTGWMVNASPFSPVQSSVIAASASPVPVPQNQGLQHLRTLSNAHGMIENKSTDHGQLMKRKRPRSKRSVDKNGVEPMSRGIGKRRNLEDASDKTKPWELTEIVDPTQCQTVTIPENSDTASNVTRLLYTNSGVAVLALWSNGVQKLWKWGRSEENPSGKATASIIPQLWQPKTGLLMTNDVPDNSEDAVPCITLSKNDCYVISACGGKVSLFNLMTFKVLSTFMPPPPASTFFAFHPLDNNIIAIGMEDSVIHIYNVRMNEVKTKLKGHKKRITGLTFSTSLNILVSSGADAQLFFWSSDNWEKINSVGLQMPAEKALRGATRVQFHSDEVRLLICHETVLAVFDVNKMELIRQWIPQEVLSAPISSAAYSCNSQLVYATFTDGNIGVFDADSLKLRCRIAPSAYIAPALSNTQTIHPLVVTTHPQEANQLAVGLTDGSIKVIEPSETEKKWGLPVPVPVPVPVDIGTAATSTANASEQLQR
ncbi:hypothetical protein GQ457_09G024040 [Hibiscus cannabinus]